MTEFLKRELQEDKQTHAGDLCVYPLITNNFRTCYGLTGFFQRLRSINLMTVIQGKLKVTYP